MMDAKKMEKAYKNLVGYLTKDWSYDGDEDKGFIYTVEPWYGDALSEKDIADILKSDDPESDFIYLVDEMYDDYVCEVEGLAIIEAMKGIEFENDNEKDFIWSGLSELYEELVIIDLPYDYYLKQYVKADLMVDTGDANYDFHLNTVYPSYGEDKKGIDDEASLVWLAGTQGYSKVDLEEALGMGAPDFNEEARGFLQTVRQEVANEASNLNCLTFLLNMSVGDLIKVNAMMNGEGGGITIDKKAKCGLYDPWTGAGSLLEIELEKDITIPTKYIHRCVPDKRLGPWTVDDVYGMMDSAWKDVVLDVKEA